MLIKLTGLDGSALYVRDEAIVALARHPRDQESETPSRTQVALYGGFTYVRETPEEIVEAIAAANYS